MIKFNTFIETLHSYIYSLMIMEYYSIQM